MKLLATVLLSAFAPAAFASVDYTACTPKATSCRDTAKTCQQFYKCETLAIRHLNDLVMRAMQDGDGDNWTMCTEKRNDMESDYFGYMTTIECMDTPHGPQFGG